MRSRYHYPFVQGAGDLALLFNSVSGALQGAEGIKGGQDKR